MFRKLCILLVLCSAALAVPALARPLVDIDIIDRDDDRRLPEYQHRGDSWIAGVPDHRYAVRLRNNSGNRVLVVLSVDGVNAVSGDTADPHQGGYVLGPWQTMRITGWRKSLDDVAQFVFTDIGDSYAARTGRPENVGVIGIAVFREARRVAVRKHHRHLPPTPPPTPSAAPPPATAAPAVSAESAAGIATDATGERRAAQRIGTGHGRRESAPVRYTSFHRASRHPAQVTQLRYDSADRLVAMGVLLRPHRHHHDRPQAFPTSFVPDPPRQ